MVDVGCGALTGVGFHRRVSDGVGGTMVCLWTLGRRWLVSRTCTIPIVTALVERPAVGVARFFDLLFVTLGSLTLDAIG